MLRQRYIKKKIVGGRMGGNLFDSIKNLFSATSKLVISKLPDAVQGFAVGAANTAGKNLAQRMMGRPENVPKPNIISEEVKALLSNIATNHDVEKVLVNKTKQLLLDDGRAILSNITSGAGVKKKRGRGLARIK